MSHLRETGVPVVMKGGRRNIKFLLALKVEEPAGWKERGWRKIKKSVEADPRSVNVTQWLHGTDHIPPAGNVIVQNKVIITLVST